MKMELYRETAEAGPGVDPSMLRNEMKRKSKTMTSVSADARASTRARLNRRIWRLFWGAFSILENSPQMPLHSGAAKIFQT